MKLVFKLQEKGHEGRLGVNDYVTGIKFAMSRDYLVIYAPSDCCQVIHN